MEAPAASPPPLFLFERLARRLRFVGLGRSGGAVAGEAHGSSEATPWASSAKSSSSSRRPRRAPRLRSPPPLALALLALSGSSSGRQGARQVRSFGGLFDGLGPVVAAAKAECGASVHKAEDLPFRRGLIPGFECEGFNEDRSCCQALPMQKAVASVAYAAKHNSEQLESFEPTLATIQEGVNRLLDGGGECAEIASGMLMPRIKLIRRIVEVADAAVANVEHLMMSRLCAYCFEPEDFGRGPSIRDHDRASEVAVSELIAMAHWFQEHVFQEDAGVLALRDKDGYECVPEYLAVLTKGSPVGGSVKSDAPDSQATLGGRGMTEGIEALHRMLRWGLDRRSLRPSMLSEAPETFDEDFSDAAMRLFSAIIGPPARASHQAQMLYLAVGGQFGPNADSPVARLLWSRPPHSAGGAGGSLFGGGDADGGGEGGEGGGDEDLEGPLGLFKKRPYLAASAVHNESDDPGSAFGLVVLISNRTSPEVVEQLADRLEGPRALFLEDTCGTSLESLGHGCHGGGQQQRSCLAPVHANRLALINSGAADAGEQERGPWNRPLRVAWRRHSATRTVAHAAWALGASVWGPKASVWLADFRPASACPDRLPLVEAAALVPGAGLKIVADPEGMLGVHGAGHAVDPPDLSEAGPPEVPADADVDILPDLPLASRLAEYLDFHRRGVEALDKDGNADVPVLVYSCQPYTHCGGHGDRLNGIVTAFFLAVLTRRVFLIDSENPLPLEHLLVPRLLDWRVRGGLLGLAGLRHFSYHDKRRQFEADLERLAAFPDNTLVLTVNYRMLRMLFEAPVFRDQLAVLGLPTRAPAFLVAEVFDILFSPSPVLYRELAALRSSLGGVQDGHFIAVHLRTGDISWDPARHDASELAGFVDCAFQVEEELGLPPDTPWILATDSEEVAAVAATSDLSAAGKLRVPGHGGRIHIDRSDLSAVLDGVAANFAEWMLFGRAAAVVLSRSYFGETSAEIGRAPFAYFAPGGGCVRTELSSS